MPQYFDHDEPSREKEAYITVRASDNGQPQLDDACTIKIIIEDVNDNPPFFDKVVSTFWTWRFIYETWLWYQGFSQNTDLSYCYTNFDLAKIKFNVTKVQGFVKVTSFVFTRAFSLYKALNSDRISKTAILLKNLPTNAFKFQMCTNWPDKYITAPKKNLLTQIS